MSDKDEFRNKHKKARQHSETKPQQQRLSRQLVQKSEEFAKMATGVMGLEKIRSIARVNKMGRRVQDNDNLKQQMADEDAKASRLTRVAMTAESVLELAKKTKLTNDCTFVGDALILGWREKVSQMMVQKFWKELNTADKFMDTFKVARQSFIHLEKVCGTKELEGITSYNKAKTPIHKYIKAAKTITDKVFKYVKEGMGGFDDKSVEKTDILFLFITPVDSVLDEERIEPVEEALVNMCKKVDIHYTYTTEKRHQDGSDDDSGSVGSDRGDGELNLGNIMGD